MRIKYNIKPKIKLSPEFFLGKVRIKYNTPQELKHLVFSINKMMGIEITEEKYLDLYVGSTYDRHRMIGLHPERVRWGLHMTNKLVFMDDDCWNGDFRDLPVIDINTIDI